MTSCRDVSMLVSSGRLGDEPLTRRVAVWLHLSMCRHCRAFRRQLGDLTRAARYLAAGFEREPPPDFERTLTDRLRR